MKRDCDVNFDAGYNQRAALVARYRASGLGLKTFALQEGLPPGRLHYWTYQKPAAVPAPRAAKAARTAVAPVFQEVKLPARPEWDYRWVAEVGLPGGLAVRFGASAPASWIGAVVQALQRSC